MDPLTYFAWAVLGLLFLIFFGLLIWLGGLPGKIARQHHHPYAAAIEVCGWLGILLGGFGWPIAMVWAFTYPANGNESANASIDSSNSLAEVEALKKRVGELETQLSTVQQTKAGDA